METLITILLVTAVCSTAIVYVQLASLFVLLRGNRRVFTYARGNEPRVSVLKPVRGVDEQAYENFASICRQNYANYEVVFGVADEADPVVPLIEQLKAEFSRVDIKLVISDRKVGVNPKVNNLENAYREADGDILVIHDSDVRVEEDYIALNVERAQRKGVGAVTAVVMFKGARNIPSGLASLLFNGTLGSVFSLLYQIGLLNVLYGPSMAIKRDVLEEVGGFSAVADSAAEDVLLGQLIRKKGYRLELLPKVVMVRRYKRPFHKERQHALRWFIVLRKNAPILTWTIPLFAAAPLSLLYALVVRDPTGLTVFGVAVFSRLFFMFVVSVSLVRDRALVKYLLFALFSEYAGFFLWLRCLTTSHISWRGIRYRVTRRGMLEGMSSADVVELAWREEESEAESVG